MEDPISRVWSVTPGTISGRVFPGPTQSQAEKERPKKIKSILRDPLSRFINDMSPELLPGSNPREDVLIITFGCFSGRQRMDGGGQRNLRFMVLKYLGIGKNYPVRISRRL